MRLVKKVSLVILAISCTQYRCTSESASPEVENTSQAESTWVDSLDNFTDWGIYRGDKKGTQYSALDQITTKNVHLLEPAWEYHHGDPAQPGIYSNPIIIDGLLYFNTPKMNTIALNAVTGEEVWRFDPSVYNDGEVVQSRSRGVVYWEDKNGNNQRIFSAVRDRVYALDAKTGELIQPFGQEKDRKSTRLNSSHVAISSAVFCLKNKTRQKCSA